MCTSNSANAVNRGDSTERQDKPCKIIKGLAINMLLQAFIMFRTCLDVFIDFVFSLLWEGSKTEIPALDKKHAMLAESAVDLAAKIRNQQLKSVDLVTACIERIKLVNPYLNAVTDERYVAALDEAHEIDRTIANGVSEEYFKERPFLGVPFTCKESHAVSGMLHTLGLRSRRHTRAADDAECVRLLRAAGAVIVAVTNVPEINKWQETRNMLFGATNNPYHLGRTVGGSSGGEAALAAASASPITLCSDIGGSTRMPAFYCGLYALNPTAGHTSLKGSALRSGLNDTMASIGFVSKHLGDLAPLTAIVAGSKAKELNLDRKVDVKDIKFFYTEEVSDLRVSPIAKDLRDAMRKVTQKLSALSTAAIQPYNHAGFSHCYNLWRHAMTKEADSFPKLLANNNGEAKAIVELPKKLLGLSEYTLAAILKLADEQILPQVNKKWGDDTLKALKEDLIATLGPSGVLVFPSAPLPAPYHYGPLLRPFNFAYWGVFNALRFPAVQVPLGLNGSGLPLGVQLVSLPGQEALCLSVAAALQEQHVAQFVSPCKIH